MFMCTCMCMCAYVCVYVSVYVCLCVHKYIHTWLQNLVLSAGIQSPRMSAFLTFPVQSEASTVERECALSAVYLQKSPCPKL